MTSSDPIFAASEIAESIGWSKRRVQSALAAVAPSGRKLLSGNQTNAWSIAALPRMLLDQVACIQRVHRFRTPLDVLRNPHQPWQPRIPLTRVRQADIEKAAALRAALAPAMRMPDGTSVTERARAARSEFTRVCGYSVTERQLRALISRTLDRDRGAGNVERLELYLSDAARAAQPVQRPAARVSFPELERALEDLPDCVNPTVIERAYFWRRIVEVCTERLEQGDHEMQLKRKLREYLMGAAPFLAKTDNALRVALDAKLKFARKHGIQGLIDRRAEASGNRRRPEDWQANIELFARWTLRRQGRESQAWRELHLGTTPTGERFSAAFREYYSFDARHSKSEVPARVRRAVSPIIEATRDLAHGPRQARVNLPSIHRDWSDTSAGDFYTSDDVTVNHYWWEESEFGEFEFDGMRFNVGRGQWLPVIDERTDCPLSFILLPNPNYNSWAIHTLNARTFGDERVGLPFHGMKYEQGIWKARNLQAQFSWAQIDEGFARHGISLQLRHATTPKAKVIERVIGSSQNAMDHLPGYVGRDEKRERFERLQRFLQQLKRVDQPRKGEVDPREMLLSKSEFADELVKVMRAFAEEPQNGERLAGLSPAEAWRQLSPARPHMVLPDSLRYLICTHRSEQKVTSEGIKLRVGSQTNYYVGSERLGEFRGEKVCVFYNPELPEQVTVIHPASDPKGLNPFSVPLFERLPANTATREDFARARAQQQAFAKFGRGVFRLIAPPQNITLRNEGLGSAELRESGGKIHVLEREHVELQSRRERSRGAIAALARKQNLAIDPAKLRHPERALESLQRADALEEQIRRMEAEATNGEEQP